MRKLSSFLWWSYPRGSLEYDVMVGLILAFIFLTPASFFRDQPRAHRGDPFSWNFALPALTPLAAAAALPAQAGPATAPRDLAGVLQELDATAPRIKTIAAAFRRTEYFSATGETQFDASGEFYLDKNNGKPRVAYITQQPAPEIDLLLDGWGWDVHPNLKQGDRGQIGSHAAEVNAALQLGFGGSGTALARAYQATYEGGETLDGAATVKLGLVPNDPQLLKQFPRIELWLDAQLWVARQQRFWTGAKDFQTNAFSGPRLNVAIPKSVFNTDFKNQGIKITTHN